MGRRARRSTLLGTAIAVLIAALGMPWAPGTAEATALGQAGFHALTPARVLDTRDGTGGPATPVAGGETRDLDITGAGGVPSSGVSSVVLNVTAVNPSQTSHLTVWPSGITKPVASNLNFTTGEVVPNLVTVKVGTNGNVSLFNNSGTVHLVADVVGWFDQGGDPAGHRFAGVTPARILDTRDGTGGPATKFGAGTAREVDVTGVGGVPATGASAVVLNVTAVNPTASSHLTVWPAGVNQPVASNLNFSTGQVRPNLVVVKVGGNGNVAIFNNAGSVDVIADVVGWFGPSGSGGGFQGITPARLLDTRDGTGGPAAKMGPGTTRTLDVTGVGGVPAFGVGAVILNVTAVFGSNPSHLTVWPSDVNKPLASNLNFGPGQVTPNLVMVKVSPDGTVDLFNNAGSVDVIADVVGWYADGQADVGPGVDPATVAPPLDPSVPVDFPSSTEFLYSGPKRIQFGVTPGAIDKPNSTVARGRVTDAAGVPLGGVRVDASQHQEVGYTVTRADGYYDIVVNGGTATLLRFTRVGFLPAQRWAPAPAGQYAHVDDVALVAESTKSTTINDNSPTVQVHQGDLSSDARGARRSTLLVPSGEDAKLRMPDGSLQDVTSLTVRATEFTVGANDEKAMPGELPPNSGFTYAVELSADEVASAGATTVEFSKPLAHYLENFLGFPVGTDIPNGYYDQQKGQWIAVPGGLVVKIVSITAGSANLDVTGDDVADTGAALTSLGITAEERTALATRFPVGSQLWRVPISHFSPHDLNQFILCKTTCDAPSKVVPAPKAPIPPKNQCRTAGSIIGCQAQTLGEVLPVTGAPVSLAYQSANTAGYVDSYRVDIPATGASPSASLVEVMVTVDIVGRRFEFPVTVAPDQHVVFTWDGRDAYGRDMAAVTPAEVTVTYIFDGYYRIPQRDRFGEPVPDSPVTIVPAPKRIREATTTTVLLGAHRPPGADVGGWSIDQHHVYQQGRVFLGSGENLPVGSPSSVITRPGVAALGAIALRDGSVLLNVGGKQLKRRAADGTITTVAGTGTSCSGTSPCGEGGPALAANLTLRGGAMAEGPDGSIFFTEGVGCSGFICQGSVVRKITGGILTTVAGNGFTCTDTATCMASVPARSTAVAPSSIAVDGSGVLWILEDLADANRIRSVGADGIIRTQYGCLGQCGAAWSLPAAADGDAAAGATLRAVQLAFAPDGSLLVLEEHNGGRVLSINKRGILHVIAGGISCNGGSECGLFGPASTYRFQFPTYVAVAPDGAVYVEDGAPLGGNEVVRFLPGGEVERVAGGPGGCNHLVGCNDGKLALEAQLELGTVAITKDGSLHLVDSDGLRVVPPPPTTPDGKTVMPSADGDELYVFTKEGRHDRTVDAVTGVTRLSFSYSGNLLTGITDTDGNHTTIERTPDGVPTGILGPFGAHTTLTVDANGKLSSVTEPGGFTTALETTSSGLLTKLVEPGTPPAVHLFEYDAAGLLLKDTNPTGGFTQLARTAIPSGSRVTATTAQGRVTTYDSILGADGTQTTNTTDPSGAVTVAVTTAKGDMLLTFPDGRARATTYGQVPRWGLQQSQVVRVVDSWPGGLTRTTDVRRESILDPADITKLVSSKETLTANGHPKVTEYLASTRTLTETSPMGRSTITTFDAEGHATSITSSGTAPTTLTYDGAGRVTSLTQGTRTMQYTYDAFGRQSQVVDAGGRRVTTAYDSHHRVATRGLPDGSSLTAAYDDRGNMTGLSLPSGAQWQLHYDLANRRTGYQAPGAPSEQSTYSPDGDLTQTTQPSGGVVQRTYDAGGRIDQVAMPGVVVDYGYADATDRLTSSSRSAGVSQAETTTYQGPLPTSTSVSGGANGTFTNTWSNEFLLLSRSLSGPGGVTENLTYDDDGLPIADGPFAIERNGPNGAASRISTGTMALELGYSPNGEPEDRHLRFSAVTAFREQVSRNGTGRITSVATTTPSGSGTTTYTYDSPGRLASEQRNGGATTTFSYDTNGNLLTTPAGAATYDARDRITSVGGKAYSYDANGNLTGRGSDVFVRDLSGELLSATANGSTVTYRYDASFRRTARIENGVTTEYLYGDPDNPFVLTATREAGVVTYYYYDDARRPIAFDRGGQRFFIGADQRGTPRVVRNANGAVVKELDFDAWGNVVQDSNPGLSLAVGFAGGLADPTTKLVRLGLRDYEPGTGRFTSPDPAGFTGGFNLYAYAHSDPVNFTDPLGLGEIGLTAYLGFGGGLSLSWGGKNGWTICYEIGPGFGGTTTISPAAQAAEPSMGVVGETGVSAFSMVGASTGFNVSHTKCGVIAKVETKGNLGNLTAKHSSGVNLTNGTLLKKTSDLAFRIPGSGSVRSDSGRLGLSAKVVFKHCF